MRARARSGYRGSDGGTRARGGGSASPASRRARGGRLRRCGAGCGRAVAGQLAGAGRRPAARPAHAAALRALHQQQRAEPSAFEHDRQHRHRAGGDLPRAERRQRLRRRRRCQPTTGSHSSASFRTPRMPARPGTSSAARTPPPSAARSAAWSTTPSTTTGISRTSRSTSCARESSGQTVGRSVKVSFCVIDTDHPFPARPRLAGLRTTTAATGAVRPRSRGCRSAGPTPTVRTSPGRASTSPALLAGKYCLISRADPADRIDEINESNNTRRTRLFIDPPARTVQELPGPCQLGT